MKSHTNRNTSSSPKPMKKYSVGLAPSRKKLLFDWVRHLIPNIPVPMEEYIKTGQIPYKLLQIFSKNVTIKGYHTNPNSSQAYNNILLISNFLYNEWPNSELPSPSEILKKGSSDCWLMVNAIFNYYQIGEIKRNWDKCIEWYKSILKLYDITVNNSKFLTNCLDGVFFACVLNCYIGFRLNTISKSPSSHEVVTNLTQVFDALKGKVFLPLSPQDFANTKQEDLVSLIIFSIFTAFRHSIPTLPTRDKMIFKTKPDLIINSFDSLISLSSMESLEYSKSTILSKEPSEIVLAPYRTPKWSKEKPLEIITDDSTGYSMQPYEISYETVSVANSSYSRSTAERLIGLEKSNAICERKCMFVADLRTQKERIHEVPSLKKLRIDARQKIDNYLCFLITPRLLKMVKPEVDNYVFTVVMDPENFSAKHENYLLEWKDFSLKVKGRINVSEISACEHSGRMLQIRTFGEDFIVQCMNAQEATDYATGLNQLSKPKTIFSRDISCNELILNIH